LRIAIQVASMSKLSFLLLLAVFVCTASSKLANSEPFKVALPNDVACPDGSSCMDGSTCCALDAQNSTYGCCPYADATCCSDYQHCCPSGYQCDLVHQQCVSGSGRHGVKAVKPWARTARKEKPLPAVVTCPDGSSCADGSTCCALDAQNSSYGCCPYAEATCCSDYQHCCPSGYQCDLMHQQCVSGSGRHGVKAVKPWARTARKEKPVPAAVACPDGSSCPDGSTCCALNAQNSSFGCCPYIDATCCSDYVHCCPSGYQCDLVHQQCVSGSGRHGVKAVKPWEVSLRKPVAAEPAPLSFADSKSLTRPRTPFAALN